MSSYKITAIPGDGIGELQTVSTRPHLDSLARRGVIAWDAGRTMDG